MTTSSSVLTIPVMTDPLDIAQSAWIDELHKCENDQNVEKIFDSNNRYSYGYLMFQMETWLSYGKKFGATEENIDDPLLQRIVAKDMLDKGLLYHWKICTKKVSKKLGAYPSY